MATLKVLRRRVSSVKNTQKITKAMKLVSAAKLRRAQSAVEATRPYAVAIDAIIGRIAGRVDAKTHPLLKRHEIRRINLVVITSDRGLAGGFNGNVLRAAELFVREAKKNDQEVIITAIGKRGRDYIRLKKFAPLNDFITDIGGGLTYGTAELLAGRVIPRFLASSDQDTDADGRVDTPEMVQAYAERLAAGESAHSGKARRGTSAYSSPYFDELRAEFGIGAMTRTEPPADIAVLPVETSGAAAPATEPAPKPALVPAVDAVVLIYTQFRSAISQVVTTQQILPMEPPEAEAVDNAAIDYIYEPDQQAMLDALLPRHIKMQLFRALLESVASEHGARMTAMDSASKNASEMIQRLTLQMNRARQAVITKELMEIVSGKEALEG
jgi:F-type H+-transporting ATPase subunit gamma